MKIGSIPRANKRYYCKVCLQRGARVYMGETGNGLIKCPVCGRQTLRPDRKSRTPVLRSVDPVRFRTRRSMSGAGDGAGDGAEKWKPRVYNKQPYRTQSLRPPGIDDFLKPIAETFDVPKEYEILISLPYHKSLEDVKCEVNGDKLLVQSLVIDYSQEFSLPENSALTEKTFNNGILMIRFKKG